MQIYQIYMSELNVNVRFKVLTVAEIQEFIDSLSRQQKKDLKKTVLKYIVFNLSTDVAASLAMMSRPAAERTLEALYAGCVMLNPSLDVDYWATIAYGTSAYNPADNTDSINELKNMIKSVKAKKRDENTIVTNASKKVSKQKFLGLSNHLKNNVIGQEEAIDEIVAALARSQADLHDENKPLGVFLFAGSSGVGKTHLANTLHKYLFDTGHMIRIDCGEFQHKHENQKLLGSPPGFVGYDDGGQLTNQIKKNGHTVVLLDEVEKAHQDIWNTFLRIFDEGLATDSKGEIINFRNTIIIMTTNLGNDKTAESLRFEGAGFNKAVGPVDKIGTPPKRSLVEKNANESIYKYFKPELLNRIDKVIVFNYLSDKDYFKIAQMEMSCVAEKLLKKGMQLNYTDNVLDGLIYHGLDAIKGARGLSQIRRDKLESPLAKVIIESHVPKGTIFHIDYLENDFVFNIQKPTKKTLSDKEV